MSHKTLDTLIEDIHGVIDGNGGWDKTVNEYFLKQLGGTLNSKFNPSSSYKPGLRVSNLGTPCERKLWYSINGHTKASSTSPTLKLLFMYGDILEDLLMSLCVAAGHKVEGAQDALTIDGLKGHRDCVIDGVTVDIKSASAYNFDKFKFSTLRTDDTYGYISQLSSYVYAAKDDPLVTDKVNGAFLVINKSTGELALDSYDFTYELSNKLEEVATKRAMIKDPTPPAILYYPEPDGYWKGKRDNDDNFIPNGNMKLPKGCMFCPNIITCWPEAKAYNKGYKDIIYTTVVNPPKNKYGGQHKEVDL